MARRAISRPGLPKMSPTNRMRMLADRNPDLGAAALLDAGQHHAQFAGGKRGGGAAGVERAVDADGAGKAAERALGDVEAGVGVLAQVRGLLPGDQQDAVGEDDL